MGQELVRGQFCKLFIGKVHRKVLEMAHGVRIVLLRRRLLLLLLHPRPGLRFEL